MSDDVAAQNTGQLNMQTQNPSILKRTVYTRFITSES
jgi:hypothetical protein